MGGVCSIKIKKERDFVKMKMELKISLEKPKNEKNKIKVVLVHNLCSRSEKTKKPIPGTITITHLLLTRN
jgi:hypothetical protein